MSPYETAMRYWLQRTCFWALCWSTSGSEYKPVTKRGQTSWRRSCVFWFEGITAKGKETIVVEYVLPSVENGLAFRFCYPSRTRPGRRLTIGLVCGWLPEQCWPIELSVTVNMCRVCAVPCGRPLATCGDLEMCFSIWGTEYFILINFNLHFNRHKRSFRICLHPRSVWSLV